MTNASVNVSPSADLRSAVPQASGLQAVRLVPALLRFVACRPEVGVTADQRSALQGLIQSRP